MEIVLQIFEILTYETCYFKKARNRSSFVKKIGRMRKFSGRILPVSPVFPPLRAAGRLPPNRPIIGEILTYLMLKTWKSQRLWCLITALKPIIHAFYCILMRYLHHLNLILHHLQLKCNFYVWKTLNLYIYYLRKYVFGEQF